MIFVEKSGQVADTPEHGRSGYQRLFEVRLLHHHWLDDGATIFDHIADPAKRELRLLNYDKRPLFAVRPTLTTKNVLAVHRCLFLDTAMGFIVVAPATAQVPADTVLEFIVTLGDHRVYGYTEPVLRPQKTYEFYNEADRSTYRYKENVPVLSNLTGAARSTETGKALFLSREHPVPATYGRPDPTRPPHGAAAAFRCEDAATGTHFTMQAGSGDGPVFLHEGDVPLIVPPVGLFAVPSRGVRLSSDIGDDVFLYLSLTAVRESDDAFSFVDANGNPKGMFPIYQVRFKSQSAS